MVENESVLLERFVRTGDAHAFTEIVRRHGGLVYGTCLRVLADADKAADATQETFFQLMKKAHEITGSIPSWLHRVAMGKAVDLVRADSRRQKREQVYAEARSEPDRTWREVCPYVDEALESLDARTRELLIRHCLEGQSMSQLAGELGVSRPTVSRRIDAGLKRLQTHLRRRGIIVATGGLSVLMVENTARSAPAAVLQQIGKMSLVGSNVAGATASLPAATLGVLAATNTKSMVAAVAIVVLGVGLFAYRHLPSRPPQAPPPASSPTQSDRYRDLVQPSTRPAFVHRSTTKVPEATGDSSGSQASGALESLFESVSAESPTGPAAPPLDLSSPEGTVRSFVRAVASGDAESVMACFHPDGQDYDDVGRMVAAEPGDADYEVWVVMEALDPDADIPITEMVTNPDGSVEVVWEVTFKSEATVEGHTFLPGDHLDLDSLLVESDGSWLIDGM